MTRCRLLPLVALATLAACSEGSIAPPIDALPRALTAAESELISSANRFTFSLFHETLRHEPASANVFVSPLSVSMAFGMVLNGAAGATESAMQHTLALGGLTGDERNSSYRSLIDLLQDLDPAISFTIANSIWYRNTIAPPPAAFLDVNRATFDAEVQGLDFSSASAPVTINNWVKASTAGRIPEIVPAVLPDHAIMYLINAIYFKANWASRFDVARTQERPFRLAGGGSTPVPMMTHGQSVDVRSGYIPGAQVLDLPYGGGAYSMTIVLPSGDVDSLAASLDATGWQLMIEGLLSTRLEVFLPRFTLRYDLDSAVAVLHNMGMTATFCSDGDPLTNFSRLSSDAACISDVKHKTFVQVDEAGTEAAAATSVEIGVTSAPAAFVVDRPFIFALRERFSGTILFIGRVMNPAAN